MFIFAHRRPSAPCRLVLRASLQQSPPQPTPSISSIIEVSSRKRKVYLLHDQTLDVSPKEFQFSQERHTLEQGPFEAVKPVRFVKRLFLPRGWPNSVTKDYLEYQLWTVPAHVLGWMSHSLATSSMLKAVGIGFGAAGTVGTSAAIKWITKDGLGAVGRLFVGGSLSSVFDEDPKRWRMNAEFVTAAGLALEIATQLSPSNFVLLAGSGTLAKALGKGMGRPCFRVIQTYFSAQNNVGDVAAKEEVWEVTAQMLGLASSVAVLSILERSNQPEALVIPIWMVVHATHTVFRYKALSALQFPYPNQRRAGMLVKSFLHTGSVPGVEDINRSENLLLPPSACQPQAVFGCTIEQALQPGLHSKLAGNSSQSTVLGSESSNESANKQPNSRNGNGAEQVPLQTCQLQQLVELYAGERYMLTWHDSTAHVLLWEDASQTDYMRAMLQVVVHQLLESIGEAAIMQAALLQSGAEGSVATAEQLRGTLQRMRDCWDNFAQQATQQGWKLDQTVVPIGGTMLQSA